MVTNVAREATVGHGLAPARLLEPAEADLLALVELRDIGLRTTPIGRYTIFMSGLPPTGQRAVERQGW
jgi:hypothetical protein